jgi:hypothetical protein
MLLNSINNAIISLITVITVISIIVFAQQQGGAETHMSS